MVVFSKKLVGNGRIKKGFLFEILVEFWDKHGNT